MNILEKWLIEDDIELAIVDEYPKELYTKQLNENLMANYPFLQWQKELNEESKEKC
jgi:hypothetical protein